MNNLRLLFLVFCLLGVMPIKAQKTIDQASLKCQFDYLFEDDTLSHHLDKDRLVLLIGKKVSKCYSYYSMRVDSIFASPNRDEILRQQINAAINSKVEWPHKKMKAYIYKNYPEGKMTVTDGVLLQDYIYQDSLNAQDWNIEDSTTTVLGHECQMATCCFRGHRWTAWFAMDIPVSDGPWKLGGLPGLVMEANSERNQHVFKMVGIENVSQEPIVFSKTYVGTQHFEKTTFDKFLKEQYKFLFGDSFSQVQLETGIDLSNPTDGNGTNKRKGWKYKPLEVM